MKELSLHILDIVQNSLEAGSANIGILITENRNNDQLIIEITDDGKGMTKEYAESVTDPYVTGRKTRKVGLGLPLLRQNAEKSGGSFTLSSEVGKGTRVEAVFGFSHLDRPPLGDMAGTFVLLAAANLNVRFSYRHITDTGEYKLDTAEVNEMLDGMPISEPEVIRFLKSLIRENLLEIKSEA
jgi:anti-sigma regulatory factor (Ser/Thr protein kinase)